MKLDLSNYVCEGEIINTRKNSVHGYLALRGCDRPISVQLTGNFGPDLAGKHFRFEVRPNPSHDDPDVTEDQMSNLRLGWIQIGVFGEIFITQHPARLYLEWFGQNGHTVIDLADPLIDFVEESEDEATRTKIEQEFEELESEIEGSEHDDDDSVESGSSIVSFERTEDFENETWNSETGGDQNEEQEDPFGLFPANLQDQLGNSTPAPWSPEPDEATLKQWQEWDEVFDGTKDVPLSSLFDPPIQLPPANSLNDEQVTKLFITILAQLALHNVAFHMCEHFTPRSGYELLLDQILREHGTHPELPRIGYTMNFDTSEFCDDCEAEFEKRYADRNSDQHESDLDLEKDDDDFDSPTDDMPF